MADQQFCLRWNNHQSTLVSVFDNLLERGCLVDCTLAAEGRSLQAHKVVLSACSPYLEELLSQHYDKHPILLLKDVKYEELQAMMDYMYRGEVNVAQDKLGHFLQAAESLQIKGLSDSGGKEPPDSGGTSLPSATKRTVKGIPLNRPTSDQRKQVHQEVMLDGSSQDGSISPNIRKRRRRGGSLANESDMNDSTGNAPVSQAPPPAAAPSATPSAPSQESLPVVPGSEASDPNFLTSLMESSQTENHDSNSSSRDVINQKHEATSEVLIEPKTEYVEDEQDLTLEEDMDNSLYKAGPSGRQSGYDGMNDSTDEVFMAAQEAGARDAQEDEDEDEETYHPHPTLPAYQDTDDPEMEQLLKRLPAKSIAEVNELERDLENDELMTRLVHVLSQYGGGDPGATTRGALRQILCDPVQVMYNWNGQRGKRRFSSLNRIIKAIEEAVHMHHVTASSTAIKEFIVADLKNAKLRLMGSSKKLGLLSGHFMYYQ